MRELKKPSTSRPRECATPVSISGSATCPPEVRHELLFREPSNACWAVSTNSWHTRCLQRSSVRPTWCMQDPETSCTIWYMNRFFETTRHIDSPTEPVWEVLFDVGRWPEWTPTIGSVERLDDGPFQVGS